MAQRVAADRHLMVVDSKSEHCTCFAYIITPSVTFLHAIMYTALDELPIHLLLTWLHSHQHVSNCCLQGASSGIGAATAILFSKLGATVVLAGRNSDNLNSVRDRCRESAGEEV